MADIFKDLIDLGIDTKPAEDQIKKLPSVSTITNVKYAKTIKALFIGAITLSTIYYLYRSYQSSNTREDLNISFQNTTENKDQ